MTLVTSSIESTIRRVARELGVDESLAVATAKVESGLNPRAIGDNGCSVGLFQLNRCGGAGVGLSEAQLLDPEMNARRALREFARVQSANAQVSLSGGDLAAAAQRPADPKGYAAKVNAMLESMGAGGSIAGSQTPTKIAPSLVGDVLGGFLGGLGGLLDPANWWRAGLVLGAIVAIVVGGRLYLGAEGGESVAQPA